MSESIDPLLPEPGALKLGPPPYWQGLPGVIPITLTFVPAAAALVAGGIVLFGWYAIRVAAISTATALLADAVLNALRGRSRSWSESHALLTGLLLAATLPPTVSWQIAVVGALISVAVGEVLSGGVGNYTWHPVALGRVALQVLFHDALTPERWPVLASGRLLWGDLEKALPLPALSTWHTATLPVGIEAWQVVRPVDVLRQPLDATNSEPASALAALVRDTLPPWWDTLTGVAGGAIGEACIGVILAAGVLLLWRGLLRWPMLASGLLAATAVAFVCPATVRMTDNTTRSLALPGLVMWQGLPIGVAYVLHHLTAGELLLVLMILAADPSSSPLTHRGHALFGTIIGAVTMLLRIGIGLPAAGYWALLLANTLVPLINRLTRRRVFGT